MSKTFEVTLASSGPTRTAFIIADRVLRIEEPDAYDRDARGVVVQDSGERLLVEESARETRRRFEACYESKG